MSDAMSDEGTDTEDALIRVFGIGAQVGDTAMAAGDAMVQGLEVTQPASARERCRAYTSMVRLIRDEADGVAWDALPEVLRAALTMTEGQANLMIAYLAGMDQLDAEAIKVVDG